MKPYAVFDLRTHFDWDGDQEFRPGLYVRTIGCDCCSTDKHTTDPNKAIELLDAVVEYHNNKANEARALRAEIARTGRIPEEFNA